MKVYTRRGDDGTTGLLFGGRITKDDLRTTAYGTTDEAASALGLARARLDRGEWHDRVLAVQRSLFVLGAQLATDVEHWGQLTEGVSRVTESMVSDLEAGIDELTARHPLPQEFVVPGGSEASAAVDLARAVVRRAERACVAMERAGLLPDAVVLRYVNRLSDYLFVLARAIDDGAFTPTRPGPDQQGPGPDQQGPGPDQQGSGPAGAPVSRRAPAPGSRLRRPPPGTP